MVSQSTDWRTAQRAESLGAAQGLRTRVIEDPSVNGLVVPKPDFFANGHRASNGNGSANLDRKYDPALIRSFGAGTSVVQASLQLASRDRTERPYEENVWVRAALKAISHGFNRLPFRLWTDDPGTEGAELIDDHPLLRLLERPNRMMTQREFFRAHVVDFKHDGEVYWFLMNDAGQPVRVNDQTGAILEMPTQVLPVRGELVDHKTDEQGMPRLYRYGTAGTSQKSAPFPWAAVIPFLDFDPYNMIRGLGDVRGVMREVDLYFQAYRYLDAAVRNGGDPGGFIIFEERLTREEMDARQEIVDDTFTHDQAKRHRVMDRGARYVPNNTKPKDMEYRSLFEWQRDSILAGLGVPPPVVGDYSRAHFNNILEARREMWEGSNGILALVELTEDVILNRLIHRLSIGVLGEVGHAHPAFDTSGVEILKRDTSEQIKTAAEVSAKGIAVSFNDALRMQGVDVESPETGDELWVDDRFRTLGEPSNAARDKARVPRNENTALSTDEAQHIQLLDTELQSDERAATFTPSQSIARALVRWLTAYERAQLSKVRKVARGKRALTKTDLKRLALNEAAWAEKLEEMVRGPVKSLWNSSLKAARKKVGGPFVSVTDPLVLEEIADQVLQLSEGVASTTANRVRSALIRSLTGAGDVPLVEAVRQALPKLTEELKAVFGTKDARALAISRTETGRAQNGANFRQMKEAGVDTIRWVTAGDGEVRQSHVDAARQGPVKYGTRFSNGLRYPHDPRGAAGEVVNCRCTFEVVKFKDE